MSKREEERTDELKTGRVRGWWNAIKPRAEQAVRRTTEPMMKIAAHGKQTAMNAGRDMARRVLSLQKMAGLSQRIIERSVKTTLSKAMKLEGDKAWQNGYREVVKDRQPQLFQPVKSEPKEDIDLDDELDIAAEADDLYCGWWNKLIPNQPENGEPEANGPEPGMDDRDELELEA